MRKLHTGYFAHKPHAAGICFSQIFEKHRHLLILKRDCALQGESREGKPALFHQPAAVSPAHVQHQQFNECILMAAADSTAAKLQTNLLTVSGQCTGPVAMDTPSIYNTNHAPIRFSPQVAYVQLGRDEADWSGMKAKLWRCKPCAHGRKFCLKRIRNLPLLHT